MRFLKKNIDLIKSKREEMGDESEHEDLVLTSRKIRTCEKNSRVLSSAEGGEDTREAAMNKNDHNIRLSFKGVDH